MFILFAVIYGFAYGGLSALMTLIMAEFFGLSSLGVIVGFTNCSTTIGESIGPVLSGKIFDVTSSYQPAFLVCIALIATAIVLSLFIKPILR